jgi:hypothetical protein
LRTEGGRKVLFDQVFANARWRGRDQFPSCDEWKREIDLWLQHAQQKSQLERYRPRLNAKRVQRDEALAEIYGAYVMEELLGFEVVDWERPTVGGLDVDFVVRARASEILCEVKSPGWEGQLTQDERKAGRTDLPKHIVGDGRWIATWERVRYTMNKAYPKFPSNTQNLLVLVDDFFVAIGVAAYAFGGYVPFSGSATDRGHAQECVESHWENLGGVLLAQCYHHMLAGMQHACQYFANPRARSPILAFPERIERIFNSRRYPPNAVPRDPPEDDAPGDERPPQSSCE